jgi:DNA-binding NarL/FixJ family response regulator
MAAKLGITERGVEMRRARIMQTLAVRSLADLLDIAITHRMLSGFLSGRPQPPLLPFDGK